MLHGRMRCMRPRREVARPGQVGWGGALVCFMAAWCFPVVVFAGCVACSREEGLGILGRGLLLPGSSSRQLVPNGRPATPPALPCRLTWSEMFESFLANKYTAAKRCVASPFLSSFPVLCFTRGCLQGLAAPLRRHDSPLAAALLALLTGGGRLSRGAAALHVHAHCTPWPAAPPIPRPRSSLLRPRGAALAWRAARRSSPA